ncbi:MAG: hypothetical protein KDK91_12210 [Gammaproteobacteria bacterium]|nr:hypothetical protein [Gammaproteobacteria bacterium]
MNRRQLIVAASIAAATPALPALAAGRTPVDYSREAFDAALKSGKPLLLDFFAPW